MKRNWALVSGLAACAALRASADTATSFGFDDVVAEARSLADAPFVEHVGPQLPAPLRAAGYDAWRKIRFRESALDAPWSATRFRVRLFPRGGLYDKAVDVRLVEDGRERRLAFDPALFDAPRETPLAGLPADFGFGGAGIDFEERRGERPVQVLHFLGASYFRSRGLGDVFGASARGLAVGTGSEHEEFPRFRTLWLVRPDPGADAATVFALLDGPSVAGAYRFVVRPGAVTVVDVEAHVFPRVAGARIGLAPLTSMFLHGENAPPRTRDWRPEVHDSDGLVLEDGTGERLWRPLRNPKATTLDALAMKSPRGFGLLQRDREDEGTSWARAARVHAGHTILGVVGGALVAFAAPGVFWWMSPVLLGLALSIPLSVLSGSPRVGERLRRARLLVTPDETQAPPLLARFRAERAAADAWFAARGDDPMRRVIVDPVLNAVHLDQLAATPAGALASASRRERIERVALRRGPGLLRRPDRLALLSDATLLARLHRAHFAR